MISCLVFVFVLFLFFWIVDQAVIIRTRYDTLGRWTVALFEVAVCGGGDDDNGSS